MGNTPSSSSRQHGGSTPQSPAYHERAGSTFGSAPGSNARREPRRRESIQALSNVKATAAPPSASLESATAHSTTAARGPLRPSSRGRAQTVATPQLKAEDAAALERMGNEQSHRKAGSAASSPPIEPSPLSRPVDVPVLRPDLSSVDADSSQPDSYHMGAATYNRPPRLPLPIQEEVHTPGSPIISPADLTSPLSPEDVDVVLPRRTSVLSNTTADEDDVGDESLDADAGLRPAVPTVIEWLGPGEKVYVTGTFAGWNRKYRLHKDGPSMHKDAFSATINLQPGTHHLKFLVDGEMQLSPMLPTAVDFTNILVNYLEVSPDDLPATQPSEPVNVPGKEPQSDTQPELCAPPGVYPPQVLPPTPELRPVGESTTAPPVPAPETSKPIPVAPAPPKQYHSAIPRYLADLDAEEDSSRAARASAVMNTTPMPPSLPVMLSKSILNGSTPMKDDSSVLNMPNHTVLNHLATSSIKHNVLATSATTRYKRKVGFWGFPAWVALERGDKEQSWTDCPISSSRPSCTSPQATQENEPMAVSPGTRGVSIHPGAG
ncbi:carbohydrate-binding module family 48 protein [Aplosporella prunicola CBS 121167]|uniref:Carbohydrate-binding module family 48 protein n=1 Tax=Aplosporella prunicola CBS 121167 TaxID=1176127 RepID=A0A6A6BFK7_9PEZI|nr:carbohydrate-binding module family 48 protein [Aplosporella prunicola CBS 121167]KAF2142950.1 carbohydrate-binding module family 48 protein [Aplosporella prunicola CBS 121167]